MSKMQRTKGHSFERLVAQWFQDAGWPDARRQLEYHVKDALGVDLQDTEPFAVQCKRGRCYAPITSIEEIQKEQLPKRLITAFDNINGHFDYPTEGIPLLVTKADNKPAMAVIPAEEFFKLLRLAYGRPGNPTL